MSDTELSTASILDVDTAMVVALGVGSVFGALVLLSLQVLRSGLDAAGADSSNPTIKTISRVIEVAVANHAQPFAKDMKLGVTHLEEEEEDEGETSWCGMPCVAHRKSRSAATSPTKSSPRTSTYHSLPPLAKLGIGRNKHSPNSLTPSHLNCADVDLQLELKLMDRLSDLLNVTRPKPHSCEEAAQRLVAALGARACMARFLQARQLSLELADLMFREVAAWRAENADRVFEDKAMLADWDDVGPYWLGVSGVVRAERDGPIPVSYCRFAYLLPLFEHFPQEKLFRSYVRHMECMLEAQLGARAERIKLGFPKASDHLGPPRMVEVFDLEGLGFRHLRCLSGIKVLAQVLTIGQKYYPENLDRAYVLGAPRFVEAFLSIVRPVLHKNTVAKIIITSEKTHPDLLKLLGEDTMGNLRRSVKPFPLGAGDPAALRPTAAQVGPNNRLVPPSMIR